MILLDTHVVLWWQAGGARLSARAQREIARAGAVFVSPVSCWEIATLCDLRRIALDRDVREWVRALYSEPNVELGALTPQAAAGAGRLGSAGFHGDPADRLLYATARDLAVPFMTKDTRIRDYAREARDVRCIW